MISHTNMIKLFASTYISCKKQFKMSLHLKINLTKYIGTTFPSHAWENLSSIETLAQLS